MAQIARKTTRLSRSERLMARHGYLVRTAVTESRAAAEVPLLERITNAAEFGRER